jgi:hypothetical protein
MRVCALSVLIVGLSVGCVESKSDSGDETEEWEDGSSPSSDVDDGVDDWADAGGGDEGDGVGGDEGDGVGGDDGDGVGGDADADVDADGSDDAEADDGADGGDTGTDEGSTDEGSTDEGSTDEGSTDDGGTDDGGTDDGGTDGDSLDADSDDSVEIDPDAPVATCSVSPAVVEAITEPATWSGSGSTDPGGSPLTYEWTLVVQPWGSAVSMPSGSPTSPDRPGFLTDLAGDYVGQLVVTNAEGLSSPPCEAVLVAEPDADLWVEMFWEYPGDDMDLHLVAPGGTLRTPSDCYFMNCVEGSWSGGLDWGVTGVGIDDPSLDLDDIPGTGPENINIDEPESGLYTVIVHDYPATVLMHGNQVTVFIYLDGELVWGDSRMISGEDTDTYFAEIDTNMGSVTSL